MNQAVVAFRRYEDASLRYAGIESHEGLTQCFGRIARTARRKNWWLEGAPELVAEVALPSNRKLQRKAVSIGEHGAEQVWLSYRKTQTVTVMTSEVTTEARRGEALEFRRVRVAVTSCMKKGLTH